MTHRQESRPVGRTPAPRDAAAPSGDRGRLPVNGDAAPPLLWPALAQAVDERQRAAWLQQATEGVLYAHHLHPADAPTGQAASRLARFLSGHWDDLAPAPPRLNRALTFLDPELDRAQQHAVRTALASPDVTLILGQPGTGKSRVVAEVLRQAAAAGLRSLLVCPGALALDRLLERLGGDPAVAAYRCRQPGEAADRLAPPVRALLAENRAATLLAQARERAEAELAAAARWLAEADEDAARLEAARGWARRWHDLERERVALLGRRGGLAAQARQEAATPAGDSGLGRALLAEEARHRAALAELEERHLEASKQTAARQEEYDRRAAAVAHQEQVVAVRRRRNLLSLAYWRVAFQSRCEKRLEEFRALADEAARALEQARAGEQEAQRQVDFERQRFDLAREQLVAAETAAREAEADRGLQELLRAQAELHEHWSQAVRGVRRQTPSAGVPTEAELAAAVHDLRQEAAAAQTLRDCLLPYADTLKGGDPTTGPLAGLWRRAVNLVAATPAGLADDPHFGPGAADRSPFDLVVVEHAERLSEEALLAAAAAGVRCVLTGRPPLAAQPDGAARPFHRLWRDLHADPRRLPFRWLQTSDSLVCRLLPLAESHPRTLERERLVDCPEVELRILSVPPQKPDLAEVAFPAAGFSIEQAKAFLYQQLEKLTLCPLTAHIHWAAGDGRLALEFAAAQDQERTVELEPGVREVCVPVREADPRGDGARSWQTVRVEFDVTAGWDEAKASAWLHERAGLLDRGRACLLETVWRTDPEIIAAVGHAAAGQSSRALTNSRPALQWGGRPAAEVGRTRGPHPPPSPEIDLSDTRQRQRLPIDLQVRLGGRGIVNWEEAQAVIQALRELAARHAPRVSVAVLAWGPAQARLLELLWLAGRAESSAVGDITFATVPEFQGAEADFVFLSLVRAGGQRPVGYAEQPDDWLTALTAARRQFILFGDRPTLQRRGQAGHGPEPDVEGRIALFLATQLEPRDHRARAPLRAQGVAP